VDKRTIASIVTGVGILLAMLAVLADPLQIGAAPGFGWKQIVMLVVGILFIGGGQYWYRKEAG
jgi:hypothetical protein